jgi:nucleotide-binding universal stress UspA family protein
MNKQKQILVPVDFSSASKVALKQAAELAQQIGAVVDILHVWDVPAVAHDDDAMELQGLPSTVADAVCHYAKNTLAAFKTKAQESGLAVRSARAVPGRAYQTIVEEAERGGYDLIVIGTHGRKNLSRAVLGSVAERVVRHAHCPVLVARAHPKAASTELGDLGKQRDTEHTV